MTFSQARTPAQSLQEYGRGLAGALIFSLPLLFTMEVWWAGFSIHPLRLLGYVGATFGILLLYNRFAGLRNDASWWECAIDSVEELGLGIVTATLILWLIGQLDGEASWLEMSGKIVMEGMTVAIGFSVGTAQLGSSDNGLDESQTRDFLSQTAIALCGAVLFVSNVAPTEEILVIATKNSPLKLLAIALFSLVLGGYVLYFAEFRNAGASSQNPTAFEIVRDVVSTYAVALVAATGTLFFFGRLDGEVSSVQIAQIVTAGLAASLGASAGRLLLQSGSGQNQGENN